MTKQGKSLYTTGIIITVLNILVLLCFKNYSNTIFWIFSYVGWGFLLVATIYFRTKKIGMNKIFLAIFLSVILIAIVLITFMMAKL